MHRRSIWLSLSRARRRSQNGPGGGRCVRAGVMAIREAKAEDWSAIWLIFKQEVPPGRR
jgi:hypothetical protein